jgi:hypothetical protein
MTRLGTEFVRLGKTLADAEVSRKRPDFYNSTASTYKIKGGQDSKGIITTFNVPEAPPFGSSELTALDYYFYTDSVSIGNAVSPIRLAAYKFKNVDDVSFDATKLTTNTGLSKGTAPTVVADDVLFFTATATSVPLEGFTDDFNGIDNGLLGDCDYTAVNRRMFMKMNPFMYATDFLNYATREPGNIARRGGKKDGAQKLINTYTMDKLMKHHGTAVERGTGEGKNLTNTVTIQSNNSSRYRTSINNDDSDWKYIAKSDAEGLIKSEMLMETDTSLYGDEVTPQNSLFTYVRGSKEVYENDQTEDTSAESSSSDISMTAGVKYVTDNATSGQCARFYAYHQDSTSLTDSYGRLSFEDESMNKGSAENGSDAVAVIANIPAPYNIGPPIPGVLAHVSESGHPLSHESVTDGEDELITGPMISPGVVEFDFTIPILAPGVVHASSKANLSVVGRGLSFVMSDKLPNPAKQRFRDYLDVLSGKSDFNNGDNEHSIWSVHIIKDKNGFVRLFDGANVVHTTNIPTGWYEDYHVVHDDVAAKSIIIPEATPLRMTWSEIDCMDKLQKMVQISAKEDSLVGEGTWTVLGTLRVTGYGPDISDYARGKGRLPFGDGDFGANLTDASPGEDSAAENDVSDHPGNRGCRHLSIWLTNHENMLGSVGDNHDGGIESTGMDMSSKVDFDRIEFLGYNNAIQNASVLSATGENKYLSSELTHERATIPYSPTAYYGCDLGSDLTGTDKNWLASKPEILSRKYLLDKETAVQYGNTVSETADSMTVSAENGIMKGPTATAMCFGFSSLSDFDANTYGSSASRYLFLQGYNCSQLKNNQSVDNNLLSGGYSVDMNLTQSAGYMVPLGCQNYPINISPKLTPHALLIGTDNVGTPGYNAVDISTYSEDYDISNFREKGFLQLKFDSGNNGPNNTSRAAPAARECVYASARILRTNKESGGVSVQVDTLSPFACKESQEYMVYLMGADSANPANYAKGIKVIDISTENGIPTVSLDWDGKNDCTTSTYSTGGVYMAAGQRYMYIAGGGTVATTMPGALLTLDDTGESFRITDTSSSNRLIIHTDDWPTSDIGASDDLQDYTITYNISLIEDRLIPHLWISPVAYWMWMYVPNYKDTNYNGAAGLTWNSNIGDSESGGNNLDALGALPSKSYYNVTVTSTKGTPGATYNEWLFSNSTTSASNYPTTITGLNEAQWDLSLTSKEGMFDFQDYGFGDYTSDEESNTGFSGGYAGIASPTISSYTKYRMPGIISAGNMKSGDFVAMYMTHKDSSIDHDVTVRTRSASTETFVDPNSKEPIIGARFFDALPQPITDFKVKPYEKDAYIPEYSWSVQDTDLWYGIMHYDTEPIHHQYHKAILHFPLNESAGYMGQLYNTVPNDIITVYNYENGEQSHSTFSNLSTAGSSPRTFDYYAWIDPNQTKTIPEGLAGNTVLFGGSRYLSGGSINGGAGALFGRGVIAYPIGTSNLKLTRYAGDYSGADNELKANFTSSIPTDEFSLSMHITPDSKPPAPYTLKGNGANFTFTLNEATTQNFGSSTYTPTIKEALDDSETEIDVDVVHLFSPSYPVNIGGSNQMRDDWGTGWITTGEVDKLSGSSGSNYDVDENMYILIGTEKMKVTGVNPGTLTQVTKVLSSCSSSSNIITKSSHGLQQGTPVVLDSTYVTEANRGIVYYISSTSLATNTFRLCTHKNGTSGDITIANDGSFTVTAAATFDKGWYHDGSGTVELIDDTLIRTNIDMEATTPSLADGDKIVLYGMGGNMGLTSELNKIGRASSADPFIDVGTYGGEIGSTGVSLDSTGYGLYLQDDDFANATRKSRQIADIGSNVNIEVQTYDAHVGIINTANGSGEVPSANGEIVLATDSNMASASSFENVAAVVCHETNAAGNILLNEDLGSYHYSVYETGQPSSLPTGQFPQIMTIMDPTDNTKWVQYRCTAVDTTSSQVAATFQTNAFVNASSNVSTNNQVNIDGVSTTITNSQTASSIASTIAGKTYPNYTAATSGTNQVTFTQKVEGTAGNAAITMSDNSYKFGSSLGDNHSITNAAGNLNFTGGKNHQIFTVTYIGGASGSIIDTFSDSTRVIFDCIRVDNDSSAGPVLYKGTLGTTATTGQLYGGLGSGNVVIGEGDISVTTNNDFHIDDMGIWKVSQPSITVERDITGDGAESHNSGANIYLLSDDSPTIAGATLSTIDDIDDALGTAPIYDNANNDQLWRNALMQINNEKFLFGESDPDGSNWNNTLGWARSLEGTNYDIHSAQTMTVIPRHYFFHSFTGNTVTNAGFDPTHDLYKPVVSAYLDSDGKINISAYIQNTSFKYPLQLKSKVAIPIDGQTPTHIGVTFDSQAPTQNLKLYLNGKLEDATGYRATTGTTNNLQNDADGIGGESLLSMGTVCIGGMPHQGTSVATSYGTNGFDGTIEEVCLWDRVVDFVVPSVGKLKFTRPFKEVESGQNKSMSNTFYSRLYIKDYHNIRGKSEKEVTASPLVGIRKSAFAINTL